jgi:hypothetical protein
MNNLETGECLLVLKAGAELNNATYAQEVATAEELAKKLAIPIASLISVRC